MSGIDRTKCVPSKEDESFPTMVKNLGYIPDDYALIAIKDDVVSYCFKGNYGLLADLCPILAQHIRSMDTTTVH